MGTGGIIFVAILALWGLYLVPVLVKERAARLDHRAGEAHSAAVRVLHRPQAQRPSRRVVLTVDRPVVSDDLPALPTRDLAQALWREAQRARLGVRLRAAGAAVGAVAFVIAVVASLAGAFPSWTVALTSAWLVGVLASGAVAAGVRRRAAAIPERDTALPPRAYRVATEVFDNRAVRATAPQADLLDRAEPTVEAAPAATRPEDAAETWTPVEVPGPVYKSKPASHRPPALPWSMPEVPEAEADAAPEGGSAPEDDAAEDAQGETRGETGRPDAGPASTDPRPAVGFARWAHSDEPAEQRRSAAG